MLKGPLRKDLSFPRFGATKAACARGIAPTKAICQQNRLSVKSLSFVFIDFFWRRGDLDVDKIRFN